MTLQDSEEYLRRKAERLREELLELEQQLAERTMLTDPQRLAEELHARQCHHNHIDQCDWDYGSWNVNPLRPARSKYMKKAENMLKLVDIDTAMKIASIL